MIRASVSFIEISTNVSGDNGFAVSKVEELQDVCLIIHCKEFVLTPRNDFCNPKLSTGSFL